MVDHDNNNSTSNSCIHVLDMLPTTHSLHTGIELTDTYATYELNKEKYKNKMVLIIGGGNSSFESANYVSDTAAIVHIAFNKRIQFAWDTHYVGMDAYKYITDNLSAY